MKEPRVLKVSFATTNEHLIPANEITVSCPESFSSGLIRGEYVDKKWQYSVHLPWSAEKATLQFKVNENIAMKQDPIVVLMEKDKNLIVSVMGHSQFVVCTDQHCTDQQEVKFTDQDISFPSYEKRYSHGIENLLNEETDFSRRYVPSNLDTEQKYDVIVIGSGMGGGILADQLSDSGMSVLVLEAGSVHLPSHIGNSPIPASEVDVRKSVAYDNEPGSKLTKDVHLNLGGRSLYWSSVIPRMNKWDLEHWDKDIVDYLEKGGYTRAERLFRMRTEYNNYEKVLRARIEEELPEYKVRHLPRSYHQEMSWITMRQGNPDERPTGYFSTAALLLNSVSYPDMGTGGENITINLNHLVTRLEWDGRKVTGVVCQDLINHKERIYRGNVVVLAAGATESPCIAVRSGLNDQSRKIGYGLTDHQSAALDFEIPRRSIAVTPRDQAKLFLLPNPDAGNTNKFSCEIAINHRFWEPRYEDDDLYKEKLGDDDAPIKSTIKFLFPRALNDSNWVKRGEARPIVNVAPMQDRPFEKEATELKNQVLKILGVDPSTAKKPLKYREESETYHTGGSLRIGGLGKGVVDNHLKFHEYDNLYCCDLSVFPYIPTANPSLTLGALALRLAEHIKEYMS
ncbi:MAG: GMC family oxidoreductase [Oculatellaceae cyanobacterium bins.114]|nr:GMC family oxidoreductase [Oculatellaceae cyanobacterium bins.114]